MVQERIGKEKKIVEKTREMVLNMIDWDCEVKTLFREKTWVVSSAIDWFFENVEEAHNAGG